VVLFTPYVVLNDSQLKRVVVQIAKIHEAGFALFPSQAIVSQIPVKRILVRRSGANQIVSFHISMQAVLSMKLTEKAFDQGP
jgi:hypothetical protein